MPAIAVESVTSTTPDSSAQPSSPGWSGPPASRAWRGAAVGFGLVAVSVVMSLAGAASVVQFAYPAAAVVIALAFLLRRSWYSYFTFTVVMWLLSAEVRRFADWKTVYHEQSLISVTASLVSLIALPWALSARRRVHRDVAVLMVVAMVALSYGLIIGALQNGVAPAIADVLYLVAPFVTGLYVLTVLPDDRRLQQVIRSIAVWGCIGLGAYGLVQFLALPPWDAAWIADSGVTNLGDPVPGEFRVFSTLSTTGPLGQVLAALLLLLVAERRIWRQSIAAAVGLLALAASLVRAGWIGLVVGAVALLALGRSQVTRLGAVLLVLVCGVILVGGPVLERVSSRAERSATATTDDVSLVVRMEFQARIAPQVLSDAVGQGMGATGRATDLAAPTQLEDPKYRNFDSGVFETLTRYGVLVGGALLISLVVAVTGITRRARSGTLFDAASAAAIIALTVGMLFTDTTKAVYGLILWVLIAAQGRVRRAVQA